MNKGRCVCEAIEYEIKVSPFDGVFCHCSICRRLTGSAFGAYGTVLKTDIVWLKGKRLLRSYKQNRNSTRLFCSSCGSFMMSTHELAPDKMYLSLGCLENNEDISIDYQQFIADKPKWSKLDRSIPYHDAWPDWIHTRITRHTKTKKHEDG